MKQKLLQKPLLLLFALIVGSSSVWADTVTRTENFTSSAATNDQYDCSSSITTAANQTDWNYVWTPSGSGTVFKSGIKLGKSGGTGSVTNTTMLSGIATGTSITIKVYAARWNTDTGNITVTYNGSSESNAPANSAITSTSNTYSASDFSSSTNFTITKAADVTSFTIASSAKRILIDKVEVVYEDGPAKSANDLAWSAASKDVTYSETPYDLPTLTNPHSLAVTYESSNESVATIASDGTVTIKNVTGSTTISAHTDGDATYAAGTVSYTLNVTSKAIIEDGVFNFGLGIDYASGMSEGTTIAENEATWTAVNITMDVAGRNCWYNDGTFRLYKESGGIDAGSVTLNCSSGKVITQIEFTDQYTGTGALSNITANKGTYNVTSSSAIWTGAAQSVTFTTGSSSTYIKTITVTYGSTVPVTITTADYATFCSGVDLDFSETGITVYKAKVESNKVKFTEVSGGLVPAYTGVLLYKDVNAETVVNVPVTTGVTALSENELVGVTADTEVSYGTGPYNYILQMDGGNLVFRKARGAKLRANRAYLSTSYDVTAPGARELEVSFGDETAINALENSNKVNDGAIYDLSGRRVENPTKGIYIMNGKKVVIK